ncbi:MAG: GlsB/YeaQ/YmgE family stress response membrane protein [Eubacteriales bacterium]|nr:GlsB/YeaQ/YmgE family stress response membrane protein [Eubacteriales bacterium]MDD3537434.1 GlsB/YeaQ/YmgE family stress response membrane protein [Eubacteriales bacterium]NLV69661.1 GlsB/YeaQ/YmgE family stress response membrane protein [Clostridiales bacterium]HPF18946.1 GlsB/YeaQ/YmgE family stress response membrane protein [Bacillota bacterium]
MGNIINTIITILIGGLAGWIAGRLMNKSAGVLFYIIIGILGGFFGSLLFGLLGFSANSPVATIIVAVAGACLLIFLIDKIKGK